MSRYTTEEMREYMRFRRPPEMIERTEAKLARLYAEAKAVGINDLGFGFTANAGWGREVQIAQAEADLREVRK